MTAGRYSHLLNFQTRTVTPNGSTFTITWPIGFQEWGDPQRATETSCRFTMRYRRAPDGTDIAPDTHRIIWKNIIWNITSVTPVDRREREMDIDCDFSEMIEVTHFQSLVREYIAMYPIIRPRI